jgi:hypothetical protein
MAHYKRKKPRTKVRCTMCSSGRHVKHGISVAGRGGRANQPAFWPTVKDSTEQ